VGPVRAAVARYRAAQKRLEDQANAALAELVGPVATTTGP
jgi:hypothetical protein